MRVYRNALVPLRGALSILIRRDPAAVGTRVLLRGSVSMLLLSQPARVSARGPLRRPLPTLIHSQPVPPRRALAISIHRHPTRARAVVPLRALVVMLIDSEAVWLSPVAPR
jgi:hypothetical protein